MLPTASRSWLHAASFQHVFVAWMIVRTVKIWYQLMSSLMLAFGMRSSYNHRTNSVASCASVRTELAQMQIWNHRTTPRGTHFGLLQSIIKYNLSAQVISTMTSLQEVMCKWHTLMQHCRQESAIVTLTGFNKGIMQLLARWLLLRSINREENQYSHCVTCINYGMVLMH